MRGHGVRRRGKIALSLEKTEKKMMLKKFIMRKLSFKGDFNG
jgi:hypothetical protein